MIKQPRKEGQLLVPGHASVWIPVNPGGVQHQPCRWTVPVPWCGDSSCYSLWAGLFCTSQSTPETFLKIKYISKRVMTLGSIKERWERSTTPKWKLVAKKGGGRQEHRRYMTRHVIFAELESHSVNFLWMSKLFVPWSFHKRRFGLSGGHEVHSLDDNIRTLCYIVNIVSMFRRVFLHRRKSVWNGDPYFRVYQVQQSYG